MPNEPGGVLVGLTRLLRTVGLESIRNRIVAFALAATLIPAFTTAWISYRQNQRSLRAKIAEELNGAASQSTREIDLWLKQRTYDVRVFAASYEVSENLERLIGGARGAGTIQAAARLKDYLRSVQPRFADYLELMTLDAAGAVVSSSADTAGAIQLPDGWLQRIRTEEFVIGDPAPGPTGATEMMLAVPILTANQRFLGVFAARLTFQQLGALLAAFVPGDGGNVYLVDRTGKRLVGAGDTTVAARQAALGRDTFRRLSRSDSATVEYDRYDGTSVVGAMVSMPRLDWAVVADMPSAAAFAQIARLRNATALLVSVLLVVVGLLAYGLGLSLVRPLSRLTHGATRVAGGDLQVALPVGAGGGELGYLTEVFNDMVARLRDSHEELERLSTTDDLTGMLNRRRMIELLEHEVVRSERHEHVFSVLMIDVDHFKDYNDTFGHPAGDQVLVRLGAFLEDALRDVDRAARYGGEEFLALLPETTRGDAVKVAERIRRDLAQLPGGDAGVMITISIGVAEFPTDGGTGAEVIAAADAALYQAKQAGRDRVVGVGSDHPEADASKRAAKTKAKKVAARRRRRKAT